MPIMDDEAPMFIEQLQLLFMLYVRPVKAASRIIDTGRFWFALCFALLALVGVQAGGYRAAQSADLLLKSSRQAAAQERPAQHPNATVDDDDAAAPPAAVNRDLFSRTFLMVFSPTASLKVLGAF